MKNVLILFCSLFLLGCTTEELREQAKIDLYFDLQGTLDTVIVDLVDKGAKLEKRTVVNEESATSEIQSLTIEDWKAQLELFYEADINKLGLENSYQKETLQAFDGIEKTIYTSLSKKPYVKTIECSSRDGKLFIVRIVASDENFVYKIENEFTLYFNHFKKKLALDHFVIKSKEEMLLKQDLSLLVEAQVILP